MAEFVMKALVASRGLSGFFEIESAAVSAEEEGNPLYPPARRSLAQHGIHFDSGKRARRVTGEDYARFDLIACMDRSNLRRLQHLFSGDPQGKVRMLMTYAGSSREVADPWYTGDFETAFQDILSGCEALLASLVPPVGRHGASAGR